MKSEMTKEAIEQICERIKKVVEEKGSCGVRWAINLQFNYEPLKVQTTHRAQKIIGSLIKTNEYVAHLSPNDGYYIYKNPAHHLYLEQREISKKQVSVSKQMNSLTIVIVVLTFLNVLVAGVSIYFSATSKAEQKVEALTKEIKPIQTGLTNIAAEINGLNQTIANKQEPAAAKNVQRKVALTKKEK